MSILLWEDNKCTNPPRGWQIYVQDDVEAWSWTAEFAGDRLTRFGMATAVEAQRACEAALLRLGVLPLPLWQPIREDIWCISSGLWNAYVYAHGDAHHLRLNSPSWSVAESCFIRAHGSPLNVELCKRTAESVFRVLLADSLEKM